MGAGLLDGVGQKIDVGVGKIFILSTFCPHFINIFTTMSMWVWAKCGHLMGLGKMLMWAWTKCRQNIDVDKMLMWAWVNGVGRALDCKAEDCRIESRCCHALCMYFLHFAYQDLKSDFKSGEIT